MLRLIRNHAELPKPLATLFQPIVELNGDVHAIECLTRGPRGSAIEEASPLFEYVRSHRLETQMDRVCASRALRCGTHTLASATRIAINVHPTTLADGPDFVRFLLSESAACALDPSRLIVEIGEQTPAADHRTFQRNICRLRDAGVSIAVDDVGFGHSNYKAILDCRPQYLKIDRYFVQQCSEDPAREAVIRSICDLGGFFNATVVAEGVERVEDDQALRAMGIRLFQGFLYGRPASNLENDPALVEPRSFLLTPSAVRAAGAPR
jgi:EAL domain-containing protein (putative c-di-GMP-specific phosphodiesterase class I)